MPCIYCAIGMWLASHMVVEPRVARAPLTPPTGVAAAERWPLLIPLRGPVVQWLERPAHNRLAEGSSPSRPITIASVWRAEDPRPDPVPKPRKKFRRRQGA